MIGGGLSCRSKIHCGSPTISEIYVKYHQDFVASTKSDFFQAQMDRGLYSINLTTTGKPGCTNEKKKKKKGEIFENECLACSYSLSMNRLNFN
jgi:hypothetical protein